MILFLPFFLSTRFKGDAMASGLHLTNSMHSFIHKKLSDLRKALKIKKIEI